MMEVVLFVQNVIADSKIILLLRFSHLIVGLFKTLKSPCRYQLQRNSNDRISGDTTWLLPVTNQGKAIFGRGEVDRGINETTILEQFKHEA